MIKQLLLQLSAERAKSPPSSPTTCHLQAFAIYRECSCSCNSPMKTLVCRFSLTYRYYDYHLWMFKTVFSHKRYACSVHREWQTQHVCWDACHWLTLQSTRDHVSHKIWHRMCHSSSNKHTEHIHISMHCEIGVNLFLPREALASFVRVRNAEE